MNLNPFESPSPIDSLPETKIPPATDRSGRIIFCIACLASFVACIIPGSVAIYAWIAVFYGLLTGDCLLAPDFWPIPDTYNHTNTMPMSVFATDASRLTIYCSAFVGACWVVWAISTNRQHLVRAFLKLIVTGKWRP